MTDGERHLQPIVNLLFRRERRDRRKEAMLFKLYRRRQQ